MADIKIYNVEALGKPLGQYSHVTRVKANEHLFIAGMLAAGETFDAQCSGVFAQIEAALKSAGAGWSNVVQFTTYLVHSQDIPQVHAVAPARIPADVSRRALSAEHAARHRPAGREQFLVEVQTVAAL